MVLLVPIPNIILTLSDIVCLLQLLSILCDEEPRQNYSSVMKTIPAPTSFGGEEYATGTGDSLGQNRGMRFCTYVRGAFASSNKPRSSLCLGWRTRCPCGIDMEGYVSLITSSLPKTSKAIFTFTTNVPPLRYDDGEEMWECEECKTWQHALCVHLYWRSVR